MTLTVALTTGQHYRAACDRKSHMGFRLVPNSVTLNDLERRNRPKGCVISPNSVAFCTVECIIFVMLSIFVLLGFVVQVESQSQKTNTLSQELFKYISIIFYF